MIGLINYGMGNLGSVRRTFEILNIENIIINSPSEITICKKLVLPGVGNFSNAMKILNNNGWSEKIIKHALEEKKPLLGICLGMQLMFESSNEYGDSKGMGFFKGKVSKFRGMKIKIPHVGFNIVKHDNHKIWKGIPRESKFYFVHSYKINKRIDQKKIKYLNCNYSRPFIAFVRNGNIFASQFHPEKSGGYGIKLLKNFINF